MLIVCCPVPMPPIEDDGAGIRMISKSAGTPLVTMADR